MTPSNDPPEIPSLKPNDKKEEEKKGGGLLPSSSRGAAPAPSGGAAKPSDPGGSGFRFPSFGTKGSVPNMRVRGLPGGSTVMDRLKNLRKKDLIFIAAGLCTLGMAPLAEHLLMAPEEQAGMLKEGFNSQGPLFPDGTTVYESGSGVGSPGNLPGQGSDVITPLNVRDPSNLVMSPGAQKKPDAVVTPPPPVSAGPGKGEADWKDVLRDNAKSGATKGIQKAAKLPMPSAKMAGAIRGLSALGGGGGGTGASLKLDPLTAQHAPNHAAESGALTRSQATPGYRGATSRSPASGSAEGLKGAAMNQADIFNRGGGAANALDAASREAIPNGGAGSSGGRPGTGDETKGPSGSSNKDNRQLGESLDFLRRKMEMEKSIDLKWKKAEWNQFGRQKMMEESAIKMGFDMFGKLAEKAVINPLGDFIAQSLTPSAGDQIGYKCDKGTYSKAQLSRNNWTFQNGQIISAGGNGAGSTIVDTNCSKVVLAGDGSANPQDPNADPNAPGRTRTTGSRLGERETRMGGAATSLAEQQRAVGANRAQIEAGCDALTSQLAAMPPLPPTATDPQRQQRAVMALSRDNTCSLKTAAGSVETALGSLKTAAEKLAVAWNQLKDASNKMTTESRSLVPAAQKVQAAADKIKEAYDALRIKDGQSSPPSNTNAATAALEAARTALADAKTKHEAAYAAVTTPAPSIKEALDAAAAAAREAATALGDANRVLAGVQIPAAITETGGTTVEFNRYRTMMDQSRTSALNSHSELFQEHGRWTDTNTNAVNARNALNGAGTLPPMALPPTGAQGVQNAGALGTTYNGFVSHASGLSAAESNPLVAAQALAVPVFTANKTNCPDPCQAAIAAYNQKFDQGIVGSQAGRTKVAENTENAGAAVRGSVDASNQVSGIANALQAQPTGGPGAPNPAPGPAAQ